MRITEFSHAGLTFDVSDSGPLDGEIVVLLHGFPQTNTSWDLVAAHLHAAGYRTLAPNQRGYSPGARPRRRRDYRLSLLVEDIAELIRVAGGRAHVVGHDWGAAVAWLLAASRPDLVATLTSVSVPHPGAMLRSLRHRRQLARSSYMAFFQLPWLPERELSGPRAGAIWAKAGMPERARRRYRTELVDSGALGTALNWYRAMPLGNPRSLSGPVRVPTTHVWSDRDVALGREGAELTAAFVKADFRFEVLPGVSHWIPDEAPDELARAVLERVSG